MRIGLYINYPATYWSQGGGETVYFNTLKYLQNYKGCSIERLLPPTNSKYDIVHLIGSNYHLNGVVEAAKETGAKTIVSSIWFTMKPKLLIKSARIFNYFPLETIYSLRKKIFEEADLILANSEIEKKQVEWAFGIKSEKIKVLRLCVDKEFSKKTSNIFQSSYDIKNYILCVARINSRKNQIRLLKIAEKIGVNIVFIGQSDPTELSYVRDFEKELNKTKKIKAIWVKGLPHGSELLKSAYQGALVHVLPSKGEFPGLSSLEAAMSGTKIVVADAPTVREYFGKMAFYCKHDEDASIEKAIIESITSNSNEGKLLQQHMLENYTWEIYANKLYKIYKGLLLNG